MALDFDEIYNRAYACGLIEYGTTIPRDFLELAFGREYQPQDWKWIGPLLKFKEKIEQNGYFCKTRQSEDESSITLIEAEEVFYHMKKMREGWTRRICKAIDTLNAADISILENAEKRKVRHIQEIFNKDLMSMKSILKAVGDLEY